MKTLLIVTALIEAGAGLALLALPARAVWLLFGTALDTAAAPALCRVAGAALLSLGVACWLARHEHQTRATTGLIAAMLLYNIAVAAVLAHAALVSGLVGIILWPGIVLHISMAVWCLVCLRTQRGIDC